mmetsp:Transcript_13210/g.42219  ORF Transcript_13210/g.42219 Transcript_13210/m.42219 type:complete len:219 (-) Transcript_13210:180-836(-)
MRSHDAPRVVAVARGRRAPALVLTRGAEPGGRRPAPLLCALARRQGRRRRRRRRRQRRRRGAGEAACPIDVLRARRGHRLAPRRTAIARWLGAAALVDAAAEAKDVWPAPPLLAGAGRQRGRAAWRRWRRQRGRGRRGQGWRTTGGRRRQVRRRSRRRQRRRGRRRRRRGAAGKDRARVRRRGRRARARRSGGCGCRSRRRGPRRPQQAARRGARERG